MAKFYTKDKVDSLLSGITAQDITDFLNYKGEITAEKLKDSTAYENDNIVFDRNDVTGPWGDGKFLFITWDSDLEEWSFYGDYRPTDGFKRLIDLFGESNSQMVATIEDKAVIFLRYSDGFIYKGEVAEANKITKFSDLAAIVKTGRAVLQATATSASGSSPVLFRPHMINDGTGAQAANILFDATGTIDEGIYTRCIRAAKKAGTEDELMVQGDKQRERLAKYSDLAYKLVNVGADGVLTDRAINVTSAASVSLPSVYTDLVIRATVTDSLPVSVPEVVKKYGDAFPAETGEFLVTITKTGASEIYVRTLKIEEVV